MIDPMNHNPLIKLRIVTNKPSTLLIFILPYVMVLRYFNNCLNL